MIDLRDINPMDIVYGFKSMRLHQKPIPSPSKEGNLILRENKIITYKNPRINS